MPPTPPLWKFPNWSVPPVPITVSSSSASHRSSTVLWISMQPSGRFGFPRPKTLVDPGTAPLSISGATGVGVGVTVGVSVGVAVAVGVRVTVGVFVTVGVAVGVRVAVRVAVGVLVGVSVAVGVAVAVGVSVGVAVTEGVAVGVGVQIKGPQSLAQVPSAIK